MIIDIKPNVDRIASDEPHPRTLGQIWHQYDLEGYTNIDNIDKKTITGINFFDHATGFDKNLTNTLFDKIKDCNLVVNTEYQFDNSIKLQYPNLKFYYNHNMWEKTCNIEGFKNYKKQPKIDYKNFICSFNSSGHVGRQLLSSILENQGWFNFDYSSKNFKASTDQVLGHLNNLDLTEDEVELYDKFFKNTDEFNDATCYFGTFDLTNNNIYNLESKLTQSFVHIVSESLATSYYPFVTEKFLNSVVTKGLFVAYAQPGWHAYLEKYYGFKLYDKIFDYSFDSIQNPVKRLIKLIEMISKFSKLSVDDWRDLYFVLEKDTIEYNYNHYFSGGYEEHAKQIAIINDQ